MKLLKVVVGVDKYNDIVDMCPQFCEVECDNDMTTLILTIDMESTLHDMNIEFSYVNVIDC